ncbi:NgoMIV family type II restriction endonuclease [Corynebacterium gerontici]|uniref:Type-2 restriction enzyme NgoMIV n=1 Tax=Corynebacterium gerontici TaxID=2079234 RepID=A0A3G6J2M3_9CORY|nr:NgoMIV family type II restriction endonuclease [Corynebacterium gerontici]AZA12199.1 Type-2 restriction enzyme NgoMIV [Corynebacterium gerontici]
MNQTEIALLTRARRDFHRFLIESGTLSIAETAQGRVASNADKSQASSKNVALHIAEQLEVPVGTKSAGQTAGTKFELATNNFLAATFPLLQAVRPGTWEVMNLGNRRRHDHFADYEPYRHLADLADAIALDSSLAAALGNSYVISPDVIVVRSAVADVEINADQYIVDEFAGRLSPLRADNFAGDPTKFIHAVVSCKWTMRSDRAQNTRAEALNLLKNRKGRAPHIVAVTGEPSLSRIASLALGTGEIDMVYHAFLPELRTAIEQVGTEDAQELFHILVDGNRLRDIADLPLDLAV